MRSGRVLRGGIIRVGDRYVVTLGEKDEVGLPVDAVEMRCDTLDQAYQLKKRALPIASTATDHLQLGDWCLQYGLMSAAAEQLMAVMQIDPKNPRIDQFEKRLKLAAHRPLEPSEQTASSTPEVSQSELDGLVRGLPDGVVEQFTSSIQPLLLNRCSTGGCHGPGSESDYRLVRPSWSRTIPRRFTQRNLYASLSFVDRQQPSQSELLVQSISAHGGSATPVIGDRDGEQLQQLAAWVHRVSRGRRNLPPAVIGSPQALLLQPSDKMSDEAAAGETPGDGNTSPIMRTSGQSALGLEANHESRPAASGNSGEHSPQDPFDPEIFNRRFLKR